MTHVLTGLSAIDSSLFLDPDKSPSIFTSFVDWLEKRKFDGFALQQLVDAVVYHFSIKTLVVHNDTEGFFVGGGFYSAEYNLLFTEQLSEEHIVGKRGLLIKFDIPETQKSFFGDVYLNKKWKALAKHGIQALFIKDNALFANIKNKPLYVESVPVEIGARLNGYHFDSGQSVQQVWGADYPQELLSIVERHSNPLVVISGDYTKPLMAKVQQIVDTQPTQKSISTYWLDELVEQNKSINLSSRNEVSIVFSEANNFVDLFAQLTQLVTEDEVLRALNYYEIRLAIEKLCKNCSKEVIPDNKINQINIGVSFSDKVLADAGCGCQSCFRGYSGLAVVKESLIDRDGFLAALLKHLSVRSESKTSQYQILEEFRTSNLPNVYTELSKLIQHKDVSVYDGVKALF